MTQPDDTLRSVSTEGLDEIPPVEGEDPDPDEERFAPTADYLPLDVQDDGTEVE